MDNEYIEQLAKVIEFYATDAVYEQLAIVCYSDGNKEEVKKLIKIIEELE